MTAGDPPGMPLVEGAAGRAGEPFASRVARLEEVVAAQAGALLRERAGQLAALRQSEQRYEELVSISPYGIMLHHHDRIAFVNQRGLDILGASAPEQVVGRQPVEFLLPDSARDFWQRSEQLRADGKVPLGAYRVRRVDGQIVDVEAASVRFVLEGADAVQTVFQDVTQRIAMEQRERELERAAQLSQKLESLGLFAGGIAQRLNSLLIGILGNASLALSEIGHSAQLGSILSEIEHASLQARSLTGQMLALAGRSVNLAQQVDLNAVVAAELQRITPRMPVTICIESDLADGLAPVEADAMQLQHALLQLLDNCAEALGQRPGLIRVRTGRLELPGGLCEPGVGSLDVPGGSYCYVEVADEAGGIPPERRPRLFDPFSAGREAGRGLGLPTVLGIMRAHRGTLQLDSQPGLGTTVRLLLPAPLPPVAAPPAPEARATVLIIDDEAIVVTVASGILRRRGFAVLSASSGGSGLALYRQHAPAISAILLDLTMPGMDGAEVFSALLDSGCRAPVIFSSGYAEHEVQSRLAGASPAGVIQKPYSGDELLAVVERVLAPA